ncbi:hypothetical protein Tco_0391823, partial [Tanacetum coccineum]
VHRHEWQRQAADDLAVQHIMHTQAMEAGARVDTLEDTGSVDTLEDTMQSVKFYGLLLASRRYRYFVLVSYPV